jgi:hypothetical protein
MIRSETGRNTTALCAKSNTVFNAEGIFILKFHAKSIRKVETQTNPSKHFRSLFEEQNTNNVQVASAGLKSHKGAIL